VLFFLFLEGVRIHDSIRRTLHYQFQNEITEGIIYAIQSLSVASNGRCYRIIHHPYKINFPFQTKVVLLDSKWVEKVNLQYIPLYLISTLHFDTKYLANKLKYDG